MSGKKSNAYKFILIGVSIVSLLVVLFMLGYLVLSMFLATNTDDCSPVNESGNVSSVDDSAVPTSIEAFVKAHKEAYILSWKAGGFLPSASIVQTMVENGFNFTNPSGTSLWQAHNMGGVKTSSKSNFPITLATFGEDSVDITGTKPGTNVGDGTGGAYTWFQDYNAGIVGKAEFMAHQTLYTGAINNTDGIAALTAIYKGGWATDPSYLVKLQNAYHNLGTKFQWLDQEAIAEHGTTPYDGKGNSGATLTTENEDIIESIDSSKRDKIVELAESQLGVPYVWGGKSWDSGLDCSGLTMLTYQKVGIEIPATSETQSLKVKKISKEEAQRGDLVFGEKQESLIM